MDKRIFMLLGAIIIIGGVVVLVRYLLSSNDSGFDCSKVSVQIFPQEAEVRDTISLYCQATGAKQLLWEFDDGGKSSDSTVKHVFQNEGKHAIKLSVNESCISTYYIKINPQYSDSGHSVVIRIEGPDKVYAGERVQFKSIVEGGSEKEIQYSWKFGESGKSEDSKEKDPYYTFQYPNQEGFKISLFTTASLNTAYKTVIVMNPRQNDSKSKNGSSSKKLPSGDEIKTKLQFAADNGNYSGADLAWFKEYFLGSTLINITCNIKGVNRLDKLFEKFQVNSNHYTIVKATPKYDNGLGKVTSINIIVNEKN
ncbi:MAG TPA: PKD domain-containing protein [Chitinophagales bacterium]|nr:PKD domain-containing protein [Chitinophagales bacterium]